LTETPNRQTEGGSAAMKPYHWTMRQLRRLYDWVLHWAETPYGTPALFILSFAESSFFPIPPDPLLMALALAKRKKALIYAFYCTLASVLGGIGGYYIGHLLFETVGKPIIDFYHAWPIFNQLRDTFNENSFIAVITAAITPIPYKVFTIAAGVAGSNMSDFIAASVLGRGFRFGLEGLLIYVYGDPIKAWIDKYFEVLAIVFTLLLVAGFMAIKYIF